MSAESQNYKGGNWIHAISESEQAKIIFAILNALWKQDLLSRDPNNVQIERLGSSLIKPCRRSYGPDLLDLTQLEWAIEHGHWWFNGPIKSLRVVLNNEEEQITDLRSLFTCVKPAK